MGRLFRRMVDGARRSICEARATPLRPVAPAADPTVVVTPTLAPEGLVPATTELGPATPRENPAGEGSAVEVKADAWVRPHDPIDTSPSERGRLPTHDAAPDVMAAPGALPVAMPAPGVLPAVAPAPVPRAQSTEMTPAPPQAAPPGRPDEDTTAMPRPVGLAGAWVETRLAAPLLQGGRAQSLTLEQAGRVLAGARLEEPATKAPPPEATQAVSEPLESEPARLRPSPDDPDPLRAWLRSAPIAPDASAPASAPASVAPRREPEFEPASHVAPPPELVIDRLEIRVVADSPKPPERAPIRPAPTRSGAWNAASRYYLGRLP